MNFINKKKKYIFIANMIVPILCGTMAYYLFFSEVYFVKKIDAIFSIDFHITIIKNNYLVLEFIRNFLLDMLWAYALVFTLFYLLGDNTANLLKIFLLALFFSVAMEILQLTSIVKGVFDFYDIVVEFLAEVVAVFIIKKYFLKGERE